MNHEPTADETAAALLRLVERLPGVLRQEGPDAVAAIVATLPPERHAALISLLAACLPRRPRIAELLAWHDRTIEAPTKALPWERLDNAQDDDAMALIAVPCDVHDALVRTARAAVSSDLRAARAHATRALSANTPLRNAS